MGEPRDFDVAIVGGGPGGSTLGALLAKQGRSVVIVERETFPRFVVGESLLPFSVPIWRKSGVLEKIDRDGYMVKPGARFVVDDTGQDEVFWFKNGLDSDHPHAYQVQRAPFDKLFLDHAAELGVTVVQPAVAEGVEITDDHALLKTNRGDFRVQVLCDVSGRNTFMAGKITRKEMDASHRKISIFAHYRGARRCEADEGNIIITRFLDTPKGWFWLIPFTDGTNSVGIVSDLDYFKQASLSPEEFLEGHLRDSRTMGPRMKGASRTTEVWSEAEFTYGCDRLVDDRMMLIGDAAAFIDPIFSSGVHISMLCADLAAERIGASFESGDFSRESLAPYEVTIRDGVRIFRAFIDAFYHHDFLTKMVTSGKRPLMQKCITSLLAGDVFNPDNALIQFLTGDTNALATL